MWQVLSDSQPRRSATWGTHPHLQGEAPTCLENACKGGQDGAVRVIISFVGGWGHAEPLLPIAVWAKRLGHDVTFAGQSAFRDRFTKLGFAFDVVGPDTLATTPQPPVPLDREAERTAIREHFIVGFGQTRSRLLGGLFEREGAELAICDDVDVGAVIAAERRRIPCVTMNVIAAGLLNHPAVIGSAWDALRRDCGLPPDPHTLRINGDIVLAALPRSFRSPDAEAPPPMRFVRPFVLDEQRADASDPQARSLVYVTLGTVFNLECGDLLARLVHAMNILSTTADVDAVIATGPHVKPDELPTPAPGVRMESFVAQRSLLPRCSAVICHGGSGTIVDALSLGIPVIVLPMGADQGDNADRCEALGTGIALDPLTATATEIADATRDVLRSADFRDAAHVLATEAHTQPHLRDIPEVLHLLAPKP
jgi:UDP:flavonoid glycosyltransferase YjiC (YdhE family)